MKNKQPLFFFCYRQQEFIALLIKLHIVKPEGYLPLEHPITKQIEGHVQYCYIPKLLTKLIVWINASLIDKEGRESALKLEQAGVIKFN